MNHAGMRLSLLVFPLILAFPFYQVCLFYFYISFTASFTAFLSSYLLPFQITIFTLVLIILLIPVFQLSVPIFLLSSSVFPSWIPLFYSSRFSLPCLHNLSFFLNLFCFFLSFTFVFHSLLLIFPFRSYFSSSHSLFPRSYYLPSLRNLTYLSLSSIFYHFSFFRIFFFFIRIILPRFFPCDTSATIFFPLFPFEQTFTSPSPLLPSSCHPLQAVPHQPHVCTIEYRRV